MKRDKQIFNEVLDADLRSDFESEILHSPSRKSVKFDKEITIIKMDSIESPKNTLYSPTSNQNHIENTKE